MFVFRTKNIAKNNFHVKKLLIRSAQKIIFYKNIFLQK